MKFATLGAMVILSAFVACGGSGSSAKAVNNPAAPKWGQASYTLNTATQTTLNATLTVVAGTAPLPSSVTVTIAVAEVAPPANLVTPPPIQATSANSYQITVPISVSKDSSGNYPTGSYQVEADITVNGYLASGTMTLVVQ